MPPLTSCNVPTFIYDFLYVSINKQKKSRGGAVVSTPDPGNPRSLKSLVYLDTLFQGLGGRWFESNSRCLFFFFFFVVWTKPGSC